MVDNRCGRWRAAAKQVAHKASPDSADKSISLDDAARPELAAVPEGEALSFAPNVNKDTAERTPAASKAVIYNGYEITSEEAMLCLVLDWIATCNAEPQHYSCCVLHKGADALKSVCDNVLAGACNDLNHYGDIHGQCTQCGTLTRNAVPSCLCGACD